MEGEMRGWVSAFLSAAALAAILHGEARAQPCNERFTLINRSNNIITEFRASAHANNNYGPNLIPSGTGLFPNHEVNVDPYDGSSAIYYDFKVGFDDGSYVTKSNVNVCDLERYTINP